ncbi:MAG: glycosyltransferase [Patescibacteria group bacterium]
MSNKRLRICLFSPYIPDHLGGGERYLCSVAEFLSRNHDVSIALSTLSISSSDEEQIRQRYQDFFQLDLHNVQFIGSPLRSRTMPTTKLLWTRQFDVMYYLTDGSLFFSLAKRNILHIQFPFTQPVRGIFNRLKLKNWQIKNTNSHFTKEVIERIWKTKVDFVHSPYVDPFVFQPAEKKSKVILNVGRFFSHLHTKRQDVLVKSFIHLVDEHPEEMKGWSLVLIGGVEDEVYAKKIENLSEGYPIKIIHDASAEKVKHYYSIAQMYWHATGYGVDEFINPLFVEHFGISTIEAMSSEAVPIVINKGGQKELVEHGVNGFLWNEVDALEERTLAGITHEFDLVVMGQNARESISKFSPSVFFSTLTEMIGTEEAVPLHISGKVSAVIPSFNGKKLLEDNLDSVISCLRDGDELLIIDDASSDDTVNWLTKRFNLKRDEERADFGEYLYRAILETKHKKLDVTLVQNKNNERFGASCNKGVRLSANDLVFVINNDVRPRSDVLESLISQYTDQEKLTREIFGVGCLEIEETQGATKKSGKNALWFERGLFVHSKATDFHSGKTAWVSGGSGLFNKAKWLELSGFNPRFYPAYWEDIDLSVRAREEGWEVLFDENAIVEHRHESTNQTAFGQQQIEIMSFRNAIIFTMRHTTFFQKIQFLFWLPYHLIVTNARSKGTFFKGFLRSFRNENPR